jgi:hypothetical protein
MKNNEEVNNNAEQPLLNPGLIANESHEDITPDPERIEEILNQSEEVDEEPLLQNGIFKAE